MSDDTITLALHGLKADNDFVRADVFARKLNAFIQGLVVADQMANGGKRLHTFVVEDLKKSSAIASIREKPSTNRTLPKASAVRTWDRSARAIYNGEASAWSFDRRFVRSVRTLSAGTTKVFDHAEVSVGDTRNDRVLRVDEFLQHQSVEILRSTAGDAAAEHAAVYKGVATGSFDGMLQVMDSRGQVLRAQLITTGGQVAIDCVVPKALTQEFADSFDQRVRVEGAAHYDGKRLLPVRVDVRAITPIKPSADLRHWRGMFAVGEGVSW